MQSDGTFDFDLRELGGLVSESIYQFLMAETNLLQYLLAIKAVTP